MDAKEYFSKHFLADDKVRDLNHILVDEILKYKPESVFEFGCGQGKNLDLLKHKKQWCPAYVHGYDISHAALTEAIKKGRLYTRWGSEDQLQFIPSKNYDVSFTCSVLDHIEHEITVDHIIADLKRISKNAVILLETQSNIPENYYYIHDYESYGFTKIRDCISRPEDDGDGLLYSIWKWESGVHR
jgi:trans-aconitate methyltransferase